MSSKICAVCFLATVVLAVDAGFIGPAPYVAPGPVVVPGASPYSFGYDTQDEFGTRQTRSEVSNAAGAKIGSYGYTDPNGIYRQVNYIADAAGFRASISTNEPGTSSSAPGSALYNAPTTYVAPAPRVALAAPIVRPIAPLPAHPVYHG